MKGIIITHANLKSTETTSYYILHILIQLIVNHVTQISELGAKLNNDKVEKVTRKQTNKLVKVLL